MFQGFLGVRSQGNGKTTPSPAIASMGGEGQKQVPECLGLAVLSICPGIQPVFLIPGETNFVSL